MTSLKKNKLNNYFLLRIHNIVIVQAFCLNCYCILAIVMSNILYTIKYFQSTHLWRYGIQNISLHHAVAFLGVFNGRK